MLDLCSKLCMGILNPSSSICDERLKIYNVNLLMREIFVNGTNTHKPEKKQQLYIWKLVISPKEMITIYL